MNDPHIKRQVTRMLVALREHGWTRGTRRNSAGEMCLQGLISFVSSTPLENYQLEGVIRTELKGNGGSSITGWNDNPRRTKQEVEEFLEGVADKY